MGGICRASFISRLNCALPTGALFATLKDAAAFAREHETRPGVDIRDEVLHALERAQSKEQAHAAAHRFLRWLEELELLE